VTPSLYQKTNERSGVPVFYCLYKTAVLQITFFLINIFIGVTHGASFSIATGLVRLLWKAPMGFHKTAKA
jgi:hypothetical protein